MWPNIDQAFLDVVTAIKNALKDLGKITKGSAQKPSITGGRSTSSESIRSSNLRVTKQFTDLDKDRFRHDEFEYVAKFFENSREELVRRNPGLQQSLRRIDANRFTAAASRDGEKFAEDQFRSAETMGSESIEYSMTNEPRHGGMNEVVLVRSDEQMIYFEALGMQSYGNSKEKLTVQGAIGRDHRTLPSSRVLAFFWQSSTVC
jgi:hypothetical protein